LNPNWPFSVNSANPSPTFNMTHMFIHDVGMHPQLAPTSLPALAPIMPWGPAIDGSSAGLLDMPINLINVSVWCVVREGEGGRGVGVTTSHAPPPIDSVGRPASSTACP